MKVKNEKLKKENLIQPLITKNINNILGDPYFDKAYGHGDWRNKIPDEVRSLWKDLSVESRCMVFLTAKFMVEKEED